MNQAIHIFAIIPERIASYVGGGMYEFTSVSKNKYTKAYSGKIRFTDWYYSFDY